MSHRQIAKRLAISAAALIALGSTARAEDVQLTFWNGFTGPDRPAIESITKKFSDANPGIKVAMDIMPWDSLMQKLLTTLSAGEGPDVIAVHFQFLPQYAASGQILDLSDHVKPGSGLDPANWSKGLQSILQYDGKYYAVPINFATLMLYYNKDLFKAAGLDPAKPPTTWAEWMDAAKKLSSNASGAQQYGLAIGEHETIPNWPIFLWGNGADVVAAGKPGLSDAKSVEALKVWSDLVVKDKISPTGLNGAEADKLFQTQKAAMEVTGPWMTNGFTAAGLNYDVAPIPAGPAGAVTLGDSVILIVNKNTKHPAEAVKFLEHWNAKPAQVAFSSATGFPPSRLDITAQELAGNPWAAKFASVAANVRFYLPGQENFNQIDQDVFVPMIQAITLGKSSVEAAAKAADGQLAGLVK
jgi:multiple sugar transport system substrate-binding protein